jgi:hypothetical protein
MTALAPIALFVYSRPIHTRKTVEALKRNILSQDSDLIIYCDAPKSAVHAEMVSEVRQYVRQIDGFKSVTIIERENNLGLARSIINGVSQVCEERGRVIVLEDDLIVSPFFLQYMNDALVRYEDQPEVVSIHGYSYPVSGKLPDTFFIRGADCWGWGTWKRGWDIFEPDGAKLLADLNKRCLGKTFNYNDAYSFMNMLKDQILGINDSWAIRWHASAFLANRLTLYPGLSLVSNIGFDATGTHGGTSSGYDVELSMNSVLLTNIPIVESLYARSLIEKYFRRTQAGHVLNILRLLKRCALRFFKS